MALPCLEGVQRSYRIRLNSLGAMRCLCALASANCPASLPLTSGRLAPSSPTEPGQQCQREFALIAASPWDALPQSTPYPLMHTQSHQRPPTAALSSVISSRSTLPLPAPPSPPPVKMKIALMMSSILSQPVTLYANFCSKTLHVA